MDIILELTVNFIFLFFPAGIILLFISQQKESIIHNKGIYPEGVNKFFRPWGLKVKELKRVQNDACDDETKSRIGQVIYLRRLGFGLLVSFPLLLIAYELIRSFLEKE